MAVMLGRTGLAAIVSRWRSEVSIVTSWRRRVTIAESTSFCGSEGAIRWRSSSPLATSAAAYSPSIAASIRSVLARYPMALAKSRARLALTTAAGRPAACSSQATARS